MRRSLKLPWMSLNTRTSSGTASTRGSWANSCWARSTTALTACTGRGLEGVCKNGRCESGSSLAVKERRYSSTWSASASAAASPALPVGGAALPTSAASPVLMAADVAFTRNLLQSASSMAASLDGLSEEAPAALSELDMRLERVLKMMLSCACVPPLTVRSTPSLLSTSMLPGPPIDRQESSSTKASSGASCSSNCGSAQAPSSTLLRDTNKNLFWQLRHVSVGESPRSWTSSESQPLQCVR